MSKIKLVINNTKQQREKEKFFIKKELQSILNLYAKMDSNGSLQKLFRKSTGRELLMH